jgi:hypothetical protein
MLLLSIRRTISPVVGLSPVQGIGPRNLGDQELWVAAVENRKSLWE